MRSLGIFALQGERFKTDWFSRGLPKPLGARILLLKILVLHEAGAEKDAPLKAQRRWHVDPRNVSYESQRAGNAYPEEALRQREKQ